MFRNPSERRLWITAAVWQALILITLSLGDNVVRFLRGNNLLRLTVGLILATSVVALGVLLKRSEVPLRTVLVGGGLLVLYGVALFLIERPEEKVHLVQYGAVTALVFAALRARYLPEQRLGLALVVAFLVGSALGWLDEGVQYLLPDRVYELRDVLLNVEAAALAAVSSWLLFRSAGKSA